MLDEGKFKMKDSIFTHDRTDPLKLYPTTNLLRCKRYLGLYGTQFKTKCTFQPHPRNNQTKRLMIMTATQQKNIIILSQVNSMYDLLDLAGPFTVREAKNRKTKPKN